MRFNYLHACRLNKVRGSHRLKILSRFILRHKTHQLHHTRDFFKLLPFLKKTVGNKLLNGTTGAVGDIKRHHGEQFINLQYFPFPFMQLTDAFIQSDLHCIQVTVFIFYQLLLSLGIEPMILALLAPCSTI